MMSPVVVNGLLNAPKFVSAPAAVVAPVPPWAMATVPSFEELIVEVLALMAVTILFPVAVVPAITKDRT